jgi:peptidyl-prolyl cis-trans isomerase C
MHRSAATLLLFGIGWIAAHPSLVVAAPEKRPADNRVAVTVNGKAITEADLQRMMQSRQVPEAMREKYREPFLEEMIDARLIRDFLAGRKITADKQEVEQQVKQVLELAAKRGDPEQALMKMGYTRESLRDEFSLPLAWKRYVEETLPQSQLQKYYAAHRQEFDGTKVRARQILRKVDSTDEADWRAVEEDMAVLRQQIIDGEISFADAARAHSEGPSKADGGDVGEFPYRGKMPPSFANEAFQLKVGEISAPFRSKVGIHLCQVTKRIPGDASLEDVRDEVFSRMSQDVWKETVAKLRPSARIERPDSAK